MTVIEHLTELRYRLIVSVLAFFVASIVAYFFYPHILKLLTFPLEEGGKLSGIPGIGPLSVRGVTSAFLIKIKVSLFAGFVFALPVILFQLWRFITPGLAPKEKRYAFPFVATSLVLFAVGAVVAYVTLPQALGFLLGFTKGLKSIVFVDEYIGFVIFMVLAFGITFELPLILVFLAMVGVVSSAWMRKYRRHAIVACFLIGAVATPSQDPYTNTLMAVPLYLMFEGALLVVRFVLKK
jgi:sec-independent protein translocase protein TatC